MIRNDRRLKGAALFLVALVMLFVSCDSNGGGGSGSGPAVPESPQPGAERTVSDWSQFSAAVNDSSVSVIKLGANIVSPRPTYDNVMVMGSVGRDLVVKGNGYELCLNYAGIMLGGNLRLENISLNFGNLVRNCIVANGYTLELSAVKDTGRLTSIHLFCGGITGYTESQGQASLPAAGSHGKVVVRGSGNQLGNIYAGSLDDASDVATAANNDCSHPSSIIVEQGASFSSLGSIYAHGARELRGAGNGDGLAPDPDKYTCSGGVTVILDSRLPSGSTIDGRTGGSANATIRYTENGAGYSYSPVLKEIGGLELQKGSSQPQVTLAAGSSFAANASLFLPTDARLYLTSLEEDQSFELASLEGGGLLVLKALQSVTIKGSVSGETRLAIDDVNSDASNSTGTPVMGHDYIVAAQSTDVSFVLLPPASDDAMVMERSSSGTWSVPANTAATVTKISGFSLAAPRNVTAGADGVSIPVTVSYSSGSYLSDIPAAITVNGNRADPSPYDESLGYEYSVVVGGSSLGMYFTTTDGVDEMLYIYSNGVPLSGTYRLEVTIPSENTSGGQELKAAVEFTAS